MVVVIWPGGWAVFPARPAAPRGVGRAGSGRKHGRLSGVSSLCAARMSLSASASPATTGYACSTVEAGAPGSLRIPHSRLSTKPG